MHRQITAAIAAVLLSALHAAAQEWIQTAALLSDRPLLFWSATPESGSLNGDDFMVLDTASLGSSTSSTPLRFLRARGTVEFLQRLCRNRLLVRHTIGGRCDIVILDLARGTREILFSGDRVDYLGMAELNIGPPSFTIAGVDDLLSGDMPTYLPFDRLFEVLRFHVDRSTAKSPIVKCFGVIDDGTVLETDLDHVTPKTFGASRPPLVEDSPSGRFKATSFPTYRGGGLRVSERDTGNCVFERNDIQIDVSKYSSDLPELAFRWIDDTHLRYSETQDRRQSRSSGLGRVFVWVDIDVTTGQRVRERVFESMWIWHHVDTDDPQHDSTSATSDANPFGLSRRSFSRPPEAVVLGQMRPRIGPFELEGRRLFYLGDSNPIFEGSASKGATDQSLPLFSNDGNYAVDVRACEGGHEFVLVGDRGLKPLPLSKRPCRNFKWL